MWARPGSVVLKLLKSTVWLSGGAGLLVRIGDVFASEGCCTHEQSLGMCGGGACRRQFRSLGGPKVRSAASFPAPWESSSEERSGEVLQIVRGLVILGMGD